MAEELTKSALRTDLALARAALSKNGRKLRHDLDLPTHARRIFARHSLAWTGGFGLLGFLLTQGSRRTKKVDVKLPGKKPRPEDKVIRTGLLMSVLKIAFDTVRPALTRWLTQRVTAYAMKR